MLLETGDGLLLEYGDNALLEDGSGAPPTGTGPTSFSVPENTTAVGVISATASDAIAYSITGGADQAKFSIDSSSGALAFLAAPNYENPIDADANNIYIVQVTATNAGGSDSATISVTVTNVVEGGGDFPVRIHYQTKISARSCQGSKVLASATIEGTCRFEFGQEWLDNEDAQFLATLLQHQQLPG